MRHRRTLLATLAVGAVVAGAVAAVSFARAQQEPPGCDDIRAYQERYGEVETLGSGPREITVLGDSYSAGDTLRARGQRWTDLLPQLEPEVAVRLDAIPFTGFVNRGACGPNAFTDRIARAVAQTEGTLVIQGGLNDVFAQPQNVAKAASAVLDGASHVAQVIVIGPVDAPGRDGEAVVDELLAREAASHGAVYVSTLDWDLPFGDDRVHLTAEGHRAYAESVIAALREHRVL